LELHDVLLPGDYLLDESVLPIDLW
jgi:hypothetical protein